MKELDRCEIECAEEQRRMDKWDQIWSACEQEAMERIKNMLEEEEEFPTGVALERLLSNEVVKVAEERGYIV